MRLILTSDWHLGCGPIVRSPLLEGDDEWACEQLVRLADEFPGAWLVAAGDLLHSPRPGHAAVERLVRVIRRFDGRIIAVAGQHDGGNLAWLKLMSEVSGIPIRDHHVPLVRGIDFCPTQDLFLARLKDACIAGQDFRVLVVHQQWKCFMNIPPALDHEILDQALEPGTFVFSGDLHQVRRKDFPSGTVLLSMGSVQRTRTLDEVGGFCILSLEKGEPELVLTRKFLSRPVLRIVLDGSTDRDELVFRVDHEREKALGAGIPEPVSLPVVELVPSSEDLSALAMSLKDTLEGRAVVVIKPFLSRPGETPRVSGIDLDNPNWAEEVLVNLVPEKFRDDMRAIWNRVPPEAIWESILKRYGVEK